MATPAKRQHIYEVTVERTVLLPGRRSPHTYEAVLTVYNAASEAAACKDIRETVIRVSRRP